MHTMNELCFDLNISKGSRSRAIRSFKRLYGIVGKKKKFEGKQGPGEITFTDQQYNTLILEWPNRQKKGRPLGSKDTKIRKNSVKKECIETDLRSFTTAQKPSKNRENSYYMTIQPYQMINSFQGAAI